MRFTSQKCQCCYRKNVTCWKRHHQNGNIPMGKPYLFNYLTSKCKYSYRKSIPFEIHETKMSILQYKNILFEIHDVKMSIFLKEDYTFWTLEHQNVNIPTGTTYFLRSTRQKCRYCYRTNFTFWKRQHQNDNIAIEQQFFLRCMT